jgi:hypothetical protein
MIKRKCLEPYADNVSCRLLHLRASGDFLTRKDNEWYIKRDEIDDFADWAFGPNGLPELLVLAYGDLAFRDMYEEENVLFCRNDAVAEGDRAPNFKILELTDGPLWEWVQDNMEVLSACAYKSLLQV